MDEQKLPGYEDWQRGKIEPLPKILVLDELREAEEAYRKELAERVRRAPLNGFDKLAATRYTALCRIVTEAETLEEAQQIANDALNVELEDYA